MEKEEKGVINTKGKWEHHKMTIIILPLLVVQTKQFTHNNMKVRSYKCWVILHPWMIQSLILKKNATNT